MRLYEFADDDPIRVGLIAITSQLRARIADTHAKTSMSTDAFLALLKRNGVAIDRADIYDLIEQPPLSNIIANISDHKVVFKGQHEDDNHEMTDKTQARNEYQVGKMAKRAAGKL